MDEAAEIAYLKANRGPPLRVMFIIMIVLPAVAVATRFGSRALLPAKGRYPRFWWDDWTALMAMCVNVAICGIGIKLVKIGGGRHAAVVVADSPDNLTLFLKLLWVEYLVFDLGSYLSKISVLFYYSRMFTAGSTRFRYGIYIMQAACLLWLLGVVISALLECRPLRRVWEPTVPGKCSGTLPVWLGSVVPSVVIDVAILMLPLPIIFRLNMKTSRKALAMSVIACGYLVMIVSIGRLVAIAQVGSNLSKDPTWYIITPAYWLGVEVPVTIIGSCLPCIFFLLRHLYSRVYRSTLGSRSRKTQSSYYSRRLDDSEDPEPPSIPMIDRDSQNEFGTRSDIQFMPGLPSNPNAPKLDASIMVHRDFDVAF